MISKGVKFCLICGDEKIKIDDALTGLEIRSLWRSSGHDMSDRAYGLLTPSTSANLYHCCSCGFRFYDPSLAGGSEFYEEMMTTSPYPESSPEFGFALGFAKRKGLNNILDVGCGEGAFLDLVKNAGMNTCGVELNRNAANKAAAKGHRMFNQLIEDLSAEYIGGGADLLTLFQVVEHVPSPVDFISECARLVRPGAFIAIAVPSERRMLGMLHYDPPNWPPHHVSRWRPHDLARLAKKAGLKVVEHGADPLPAHAIRWAMTLHNKYAEVLDRHPIPFNGWTSFLLSIYKYLGCKYYLGFHGLSIYAILQKPSDQ